MGRRHGLGNIHHGEWRRPLNAPTMPDVCAVCHEDLFDEHGISRKEIGKIMCLHLVHSDCLQSFAEHANASGEKWGIGVFGPRSGCPLCDQGVSFWTDYLRAADFPVFWMNKIQSCLEEIGPTDGPVSIDRVKQLLQQDPTLTREQKIFIRQSSSSQGDSTDGFNEAISKGSQLYVNKSAFSDDGGVFISSSFKPGIWDHDEDQNTLFLAKWLEE